MCFKKAFAALCAVSFIFTQASAANLNDVNVNITKDYQSIEITGTADNSDGLNADNLVIKILNPGYSETDIENAVSNGNQNSMYAVDIANVENGMFYDKVGIKSKTPDGRYYVYISGNNVKEANKCEFWYVNNKQQYIEEIKNSLNCSSLKEKLFKSEKKYASDPDDVTYDLADILSLKNIYYINNTSDDCIAKVIFNEKNNLTDWQSLKKLFYIASVMSAFETGNTDVLVDINGFIKQSFFDTDDGNDIVKAEMLFKTDINSEGRKDALNALKGKSWNNVSEFKKDFASQMLYNSVFYNVYDGYGHISDLVKEYSGWTSDIKAYDYSFFNSVNNDKKAEYSNLLLQSNAQTPSQMYTNLVNIINNDGKSDDNTSGNSSKGTSSGVKGGSYGVSAGLTDDLKNNQGNIKREDYNGTYTDMQGSLWALDAVEYLTKKGVISGIGDNKFGPEINITREEFAKMLSLTMGYDISYSGKSFNDVDENAWYAPYVFALKQNSVSNGSGGNNFGVGLKITREEVCTLLYRAIGELGIDTVNNFNDGKYISDFAKDAVAALANMKIIIGDNDGNFNPKSNITRAEAAMMFYRLSVKESVK